MLLLELLTFKGLSLLMLLAGEAFCTIFKLLFAYVSGAIFSSPFLYVSVSVGK